MEVPAFFGPECGGRSAAERRTKLARVNGDSPFTNDYLAFGYDFFDNPSLPLGYGGYRYDGRYGPAAAKMCSHYGLRPGDLVLDVGCAKGYLLLEFRRLGMRVFGLDVSAYAIAQAHPDVRGDLCIGDICNLPMPDQCADLVIGKEVLPYVRASSVPVALSECARVCRGDAFFLVQSGLDSDELGCLREWDANHRTVEPPDWWNERIAAMACRADVRFKFPFHEAAEP